MSLYVTVASPFLSTAACSRLKAENRGFMPRSIEELWIGKLGRCDMPRPCYIVSALRIELNVFAIN